LTIAIDKLIKIYNDYDINDLLTEGTCTLLSSFLRFYKIGVELFIECNFYVLPPIDENKFNIDKIPIYDTNFALKAAGTTIILSVAALALGITPYVSIVPLAIVCYKAFIPLIRILLNKYNANIVQKDLKERINKGEPHNYGNIITFREAISSKDYKNYFGAQDIIAIQNSIEQAIIIAIADLLDSKGIDSSSLTADLLPFINNGIMMYGGQLEAEQVAIGLGAKAVKQVQERVRKAADPKTR